MVTFYNYPKQQWQHLRTTNPVESPFAALRLRTDAAKRFKKVENAPAVIWKMLLVAEQRFRRLKAPELMKDVYQGAKYVNGVPVNQVPEEKAANGLLRVTFRPFPPPKRLSILLPAKGGTKTGHESIKAKQRQAHWKKCRTKHIN